MSEGTDRLREVSLCWLTIAGASHLELVECAGAVGFGAVGMKLVPRAGDPVKPLVGDAAEIGRVKRALAAHGLGVLEMGGVWLSPDFDAAQVEPAIALGAELGARHLIAVGIDEDPGRMRDSLATLGEIAWRHGIGTVVEYTAYTRIRSLAEARSLVNEIAQPGVGILVDALHHARAGGTAAELAAGDNGDVGIFHLCDGPAVAPADIRVEGRAERLYPGDGGLPLADYLAAMPAGVGLEVEAPCLRYRDFAPIEQARLAAEATRAFLVRARNEEV